MARLPHPLKVVTLDVKARIIAPQDNLQNTLVLTLRQRHRPQLPHTSIQLDNRVSELLANLMGIGRAACDIVARVIRVNDAEFLGAGGAVEDPVCCSLSSSAGLG